MSIKSQATVTLDSSIAVRVRFIGTTIFSYISVTVSDVSVSVTTASVSITSVSTVSVTGISVSETSVTIGSVAISVSSAVVVSANTVSVYSSSPITCTGKIVSIIAADNTPAINCLILRLTRCVNITYHPPKLYFLVLLHRLGDNPFSA